MSVNKASISRGWTVFILLICCNKRIQEVMLKFFPSHLWHKFRSNSTCVGSFRKERSITAKHQQSPGFCYFSSPGITNVALDKPTTQSDGGDGSKAVDGSTNRDATQGNCATVGPENNPYWEVDLQTPFVVKSVKIYRRSHCCSEYLSNVRVEVSLDHVAYTEFYYHSGVLTMSQELELVPLPARWVKLTSLNQNFYMVLCEVKVKSEMLYKTAWMPMLFVPSSRGAGTVLSNPAVHSQLQCIYSCLRDAWCEAINLVHNYTADEMECQLLDSRAVVNITQPDETVGIAYWEMVFSEA